MPTLLIDFAGTILILPLNLIICFDYPTLNLGFKVKKRLMLEQLQKFYTGKKVLVTGGAGFIGSHVADMAVELGAKVTVVDNLATGSLKNLHKSIEKIEFVPMDICNPKISRLVAQSEVVFHLAAVSTITECEKYPDLCKQINSDATSQICQMLPETSTIIFSSTSAVYGNTEQRSDEESSLLPISYYSKCKLLGEQACKNTAGKAVALRYFNVYGPRQSTNLQRASVVYKFLFALGDRSEINIFGNGMAKRDYVSVFQVARANIIMGAFAQKKFDVYNIASGNSLTLLELLERLERATGKKCSKVNFLPAREFDVINSLANCEKYKNLLKSIGAEVELSREDFSLCTNIF